MAPGRSPVSPKALLPVWNNSNGMGSAERTYFKKWVCRRKMLWAGIFAFTVLFLLLGLLSLTSVEEGTASYVVLMMDFALGGVLLVVVSLVFWRCGYLSDDVP